jgi:hypothetical protein
MKIRENEYTFSQFCRELKPPFKVLCFLTVESSWTPPDRLTNLEFLFKTRGFRIEPLGEIKKLTCQYTDPLTQKKIPVEYFSYLDPKTKVLLCFTEANSDQIRDTIDPIATSPGIYHLWIGPTTMEEVKNKIISMYLQAQITHFTVKRVPSMSFKGEIRPDIERTLIYDAKDGRETLNEVRYYYGAFPTEMIFEIPAVMRFRMKSEGAFHLMKGEKESFFEILNMVLGIVLAIRKIIEDSRLDLIPVRMTKKELRVPILVPWVIKFSKPLEYTDGEALVEQLERTNFTLLNPILSHGSMLLDATVADEKKKSLFSISTGSDKMIIAPRYGASFDSFLRFFQTIVEKIDPEAICSTVEGA